MNLLLDKNTHSNRTESVIQINPIFKNKTFSWLERFQNKEVVYKSENAPLKERR